MKLIDKRAIAITKVLRIACPALMVSAIVTGGLAWHLKFYDLAVVNAFLVGINAMLTWINWEIFEL